MVSFPNIYKGNYLKLLIIPVTLIVIALFSIFFGPGIKMGVDFRGGMLVSLTSNQMVDSVQLENALTDAGFKNVEVKSFETTVGYKSEIEVSQGEDILKADFLKKKFGELLDETARLEGLSFSDDSYKGDYLKSKEQLNEVSDEMFELAGVNNKSSNIDNLNHLQNAVFSSYDDVYNTYENDISQIIDKHATYTSISIQSVSPSLSSHFIGSATNVLIFSAILSTLFVFLFFRTFVPSLAVLTGAFSDIVIALGAMSLFQIPLTLPSFAALMMLIGYSLDTDILLTTRMLKRKGDPREKAYDSMKTGTTMSFAGIIAFAVLFILAVTTNIATYYEISAVALAGLIGDLFATWGINAVMLLYYVLKRDE